MIPDRTELRWIIPSSKTPFPSFVILNYCSESNGVPLSRKGTSGVGMFDSETFSNLVTKINESYLYFAIQLDGHFVLVEQSNQGWNNFAHIMGIEDLTVSKGRIVERLLQKAKPLGNELANSCTYAKRLLVDLSAETCQPYSLRESPIVNPICILL